MTAEKNRGWGREWRQSSQRQQHGGVRQRLEDGGVAMTVEKNHGWGKEWRQSSRRQRHGGVRRRRRRRLNSFPAFLEQPLEREIASFFLQMTARVYGGSLPLL